METREAVAGEQRVAGVVDAEPSAEDAAAAAAAVVVVAGKVGESTRLSEVTCPHHRHRPHRRLPYL
jgi:hypothetical protein